MSDRQVSLYGGEVTVVFTEKNHIYSVCDTREGGGAPFCPASVTQILKQSNKPALVQWAANMAAQRLEERIQPGIVYNEIQIKEIIEQVRFAHRIKAKEGQDFGTIGHKYMEAYIRSRIEFADRPSLPIHSEVQEACGQMTEWLESNVQEYIGCEMLIYSRKLRIASQLDVMAIFRDGALTLTDWKFASGVWNEYRFQMAAYAKIYEECYGTLPTQRIVPWWDKKARKFKPTTLPQESLEADFAAFCGFIPVHRRVMEIEGERGAKRRAE